MRKILTWWNNLQFCQKKKEKWLETRIPKVKPGMLGDLNWPKNVKVSKVEDFKESDWIYKEGDRCERYKYWFFHDFTQRCTVKKRHPVYHSNGEPKIGSITSKGYWYTCYDVLDDNGDWNTPSQSELSY